MTPDELEALVQASPSPTTTRAYLAALHGRWWTTLPAPPEPPAPPPVRSHHRRAPTTPHDTAHLVVETGALNLGDYSGFFVYKLWDAQGNLLYVGQSTNLLKRLARTTYERVPDARTMENREQALIRQHQPRYNIIGTHHQPRTERGTFTEPETTTQAVPTALGIYGRSVAEPLTIIPKAA
jgi:hypothetical protein